MVTFVQLWGEGMIGDGCSILYKDGKNPSYYDNDDEVEGYLEAAADFGHAVKIFKVDIEPSGMGWREASEWWSSFDYSVLQDTVDAFIAQGFVVKMTDVSLGAES